MVTDTICKKKHEGVNWRIGGLYGLVVIAILVIGWAVKAGYGAQAKAVAVENRLVVHETVQIESNENLDATLARIEKMITDMHKCVIARGEPP